MNETTMPVLIGCGQVTDRRPPEEAASPIDLMAEVARKAAADAGPGQVLLEEIDTIVAMGLTVDSEVAGMGLRGMVRNVPRAVCKQLGIAPAQQWYTHNGGNTPQMLVNRYSEQISRGDASAILLLGAEALSTMIARLKLGMDLDAWKDDSGGEPAMLGDSRPPVNEHELAYGVQVPSVAYPLFENALRGKYGLSLEDHHRKLGTLFQGFNLVAANNPLAWYPTRRSAEEIATVSERNRYVGFPYTKYLNSVITVNMGAAVILTSVAKARELGVTDDRMVYLHGCADANEIWNLSERVNYYSSPAIRTMGQKALSMAGKTIQQMRYLDIYSCFPSAVQIACDELGIAHDDPRGLTVTGGLPYFGGPGNNYATHAIATMMDKLRADPGTFGLVNANGWFITKHSMGIYSTQPIAGQWCREPPAAYQEAILSEAHPPFTESPSGHGSIETYTVLHGREGVERALVIGLLEDGTRFIAETPNDQITLGRMMEREMLGVRGVVSTGEGKNLFTPDFGSDASD